MVCTVLCVDCSESGRVWEEEGFGWAETPVLLSGAGWGLGLGCSGEAEMVLGGDGDGWGSGWDVTCGA